MTADLPIQYGHWYLDRKGDVHGPMRLRNGANTFPFTDGIYNYERDGRHCSFSTTCDLDLLTECDRHGNPRREKKAERPLCENCSGKGTIPGGVGRKICANCEGSGRKQRPYQFKAPDISNPWFINLKGIQPVADDVLVDVEYGSGTPDRATNWASHWNWGLASEPLIGAYRLHVAEAKGVEGARGTIIVAAPSIGNIVSGGSDAPNALTHGTEFANIVNANADPADYGIHAIPAASDPVPVGAGDGSRYADHENREIVAKLLDPRYPKIAGMIRAGLRSTNDPNYLVDPGLLLDLLESLAARKAGE